MPLEKNHEGPFLGAPYNYHLAVMNVLLERSIQVVLDKRVTLSSFT